MRDQLYSSISMFLQQDHNFNLPSASWNCYSVFPDLWPWIFVSAVELYVWVPQVTTLTWWLQFEAQHLEVSSHPRKPSRQNGSQLMAVHVQVLSFCGRPFPQLNHQPANSDLWHRLINSSVFSVVTIISIKLVTHNTSFYQFIYSYTFQL